MTTPTLPRGLRVVASPHSQGIAGGVDRTPIDGGPSRYATAYDRGPQTFNIAMVLTGLEFQVWTVFLHRTLRKGAVSFLMPLNSGMGLSDHLVNILPDSYTATRLGGDMHSVTFQVEGESQAYEPTAAEAEALIDLFVEYGADSDALLRRIAQFALVDTLALDF